MGLIGDFFEAKNSSWAARQAALVQSNSADNARNVVDQYNDRERGDTQPFLNAGQASANTLSAKMADGSLTAAYPGGDFHFSGVDLQNDPAYNFDLQQGQQAIQRSAAAQGGLVSGGTLKDLNDYSQNYAANQYQQSYQNALAAYQQAYNQWNNQQTNTFNRLSGTASLGLDAARQNTATGINNSNQAANLLLDAGNAQAAGIVGKSNAWNNAINNGNNQLTEAAAMLFGG